MTSATPVTVFHPARHQMGAHGGGGHLRVEKGHYEVSVAVAEQQLLPEVRASAPDTVLLADGLTCRTQLEGLTDRTGIHLAQLLGERLPASVGAEEGASPW